MKNQKMPKATAAIAPSTRKAALNPIRWTNDSGCATGKGSAQTRRRRYQSQGKIEAPGSACEIGDDQHANHPKNGAADSVHQLHPDEPVGTIAQCITHAANRQRPEADEKHSLRPQVEAKRPANIATGIMTSCAPTMQTAM